MSGIIVGIISVIAICFSFRCFIDVMRSLRITGVRGGNRYAVVIAVCGVVSAICGARLIIYLDPYD